MKITTQILLFIFLMGCSPTNPKGKGISTSKGTVKNGELINGKGASTDVIEASAKAYLNAVNRYLSNKRRKKTAKKKAKGQP